MLTYAYDILDTLHKSGYKAAIVGGYVRDLLMGYRSKDIDIVTSATPDQVQRLFCCTTPVGQQFGVTVVILGGYQFEVATLREDGEYYNGRSPSTVSYSSSYYADSKRRDFTINAMYLEEGEPIIDYHNGRQDLRSHVIKAVGNPRKRFKEDKLRMLRALRFSAKLGFNIEPKTSDAIRSLAEMITQVSVERIKDEIEKIMYVGGIRLLEDYGFLDILFPEVAALRNVEQRADFHPEGNALEHTMIVVNLVPRRLQWAALLHDLGKAKESYGHEFSKLPREVMTRLKFSNAEKAYTDFIIKNHMKAHIFFKMRESKRRILASHAWFLDLTEFEKCDDMTNRGNSAELVKYHREQPPLPEQFIKGDDLIALGITPGPIFKKIIDKVYEFQLDGKITTKEQAIKRAEQLSKSWS